MSRYTLNGQPVTGPQLAALAGCGEEAMRSRMRAGMTPEQAVAAGAKLPARGGTYTLDGKTVSLADMAALAGCTRSAIWMRLSKGGMTPQQAVEAGGHLARRAFSLDERRQPAPSTAKKPKPITVKSLAHMGAKLAPKAEVITPADVKITVAPPIPERFSTAGAVPLFSGLGPGRYLAGDTHMAKVYGGVK